MSSGGAGHRAANFKNRGMMKADELRRRREDLSVEIRKQKKEESLSKRRNMALIAAEEPEDEMLGQGSSSSQISVVSYCL